MSLITFLPKNLTKKTRTIPIPAFKHARFSKANLAIFILIFGSIGAYALFQSNAAGPNVWISTTGNDSTCVRNAQTKPCQTPAKAWSIALAGDTISVADGTYTNTGLAGTECKFTTGKASDTTFVGSTNAIMPCFWNLDTNGVAYHMVVDGLALSLSNIAGNNVTIKNGIFTCQDAAPYTLYSPDNKCSARLSFTGAAQNVTIMDETIGPNYESGACGGNAPNGSDFFGVTGPVLLKNVTFHDNRRGCASSGVQHQELLRMEDGNSNVTFDGVVLYNGPNSGWWNGSSFDGQGSNSAELFITGTQTNFLMQNSYTYGTGNVSIDGASDSNFVNSQLRNNVFTNGTLFQHAYPSTFLITNNVYPSCPINAASGSSGGTVRKNLLYGGASATGACSADISTAQGLSGIFTDPNNGVFSLKTGSPAIDAGSSISGDYAPLDKDGVSRPQGAAPDAGPSEYVPTANVWVSTTGNDSTCVRGDQSKPCLTLTKAVQLASDGDIIEVAGGTYSPGATSWNINTAFTNGITIQPAAGASPVINGSLNFGVPASHVTVSGLDFEEYNPSHSGGEVDFGDGTSNITLTNVTAKNLYFNGASNVTFNNLNVGNTACKEIEFQANGTHNNSSIVFNGGSSHDWNVDNAVCPGKHTSGMLIEQTTGVTINGMKIYNTGAGEGILVKKCCGNFGSPTNVKIINSWFGSTGGGGAIYFSGSTPETWSGETVAFNTTLGSIQLEVNASVTWATSQVIGNLTGELNNGSGGCPSTTGITVDYNVWPGGVACGTHTITSGVLASYLINSSGGSSMNYHLSGAAGSGAADNYVPTSVSGGCPTADFDSQARPADTNCDAGADERAAASIPGDLNSDSHVSVIDLSILLSHYGTSASASQGDINNDGIVNIFDLSILLSHYGT